MIKKITKTLFCFTLLSSPLAVNSALLHIDYVADDYYEFETILETDKTILGEVIYQDIAPDAFSVEYSLEFRARDDWDPALNGDNLNRYYENTRYSFDHPDGVLVEAVTSTFYSETLHNSSPFSSLLYSMVNPNDEDILFEFFGSELVFVSSVGVDAVSGEIIDLYTWEGFVFDYYHSVLTDDYYYRYSFKSFLKLDSEEAINYPSYYSVPEIQSLLKGQQFSRVRLNEELYISDRTGLEAERITIGYAANGVVTYDVPAPPAILLAFLSISLLLRKRKG